MECMSNIETEVVSSVSLADSSSIACNNYYGNIQHSYSNPFLSPFNHNCCEPYPSVTSTEHEQKNTILEEFTGNVYQNPQEYFSAPYLQKKYSFLTLNKDDYQNDWTYYWNQSFVGVESGQFVDNPEVGESIHNEDIFVEDMGEANLSSDDSRGESINYIYLYFIFSMFLIDLIIISVYLFLL